MKRFQLFLHVILLISIFSINSSKASNSSATHTFSLNVIFVGFREDSVYTSLIDSNILKTYSFTYDNYTMNYNFNLSYRFANISYYLALKAFILANSVNDTDTTSKLNATALQIQKETGTKMSIFMNQSGRAIDAVAVENWLETHPYISNLNSSYWFYVMNFTEFDSPDHSLEHWYNTTEIDVESNSKRSFWRLEWDNALNPNVKFPYAAFTSQSRILFIDTSAFQWYLTWARIWWGLSVTGSKYDYYFEDLDQFSATHDLETSEGKTALAYYLAGWIEDPLRNLLAPDIWDDVGIFTAKTMSIQTLILNNASEAGYTNEVMQWMINSTQVREAIEDLAPFMSMDVTVKFQNLSNYPELKAIFENAVLYQQNGWTYYDGFQIWDNLYNTKASYFNLSAADIVVNGYVFLEGNMSMLVYGGEYTGLGGEGQILVMKSVERYFKEDGVTPKSGLGTTLIHEAGHNLGFPHTFIHGDAYAGDFAFDVMGYYPYSYFFTQLRKDCFRRLIDDYKILQTQEMLSHDQTLYSRKPSQTVIDAKFDEVNTKINEAIQIYEELRFLDAQDRIVEAEGMESSLNYLIWIYLSDINSDGYVNASDGVLLGVAFYPYGTYNPDADIYSDSFCNAKDAVILGSHFSESWK